MGAVDEGTAPLQPTHSCRSAGTTSSFVTACPAGKLDPLGLTPVAKVFVRPTSSKRAKKPSALDKHLRHVVLLQRSNRHRAHQHAANAQHKRQQQQRFANWGHRLRNAILRRNSSSCHSSPSSSPEPTQPVTAAAAPALNTHNSSQPQHNPADVIQSWKPVAAAAQTRELQDKLSMQQQQLRSSLPAVLDPDTLGPDYHERQRQKEMLYTQQPQQQQQQHHSQHHSTTTSIKDPASSKAAQDEQGSCLDVDAFLDSLLHPAATAQAKGAGTATAPSAGSTTATKGSLSPAHNTPNKQPVNLTQHKARPSSSFSRGRPVPAWAVTEQEAAAKEAAAADAEEEFLLQFAEELDWQELLQDLGDEELSAAFKELERADAAAAEGRPDADRRWQECFVTALNAAAMKGISHSSTAAADGPGSKQGDRCSFVSTASAARRAEAAATRRQQLIHKLHRLTGIQQPASMAGAGPPGIAAPSVCGSTGSRLGPVGGGYAGLAVGGVTGSDSWDSSTIVSSVCEDVGRLSTALQHVEAGQLLAENPELKGVHSTASVRSMLSRMEVA